MMCFFEEYIERGKRTIYCGDILLEVHFFIIGHYFMSIYFLLHNPEPVAGPFDKYYGDECPPDGPLVQLTQNGGKETLIPGDPWFSVAVWQRVAESVWMDIDQNDVLSFRCAREEADERHISPLQLTPIRRCIDLWSNPGDVVFSPFAGIGSELYCAVEMGRKALGAELKESYYRQAVANLKGIKPSQPSLLDGLM